MAVDPPDTVVKCVPAPSTCGIGLCGELIELATPTEKRRADNFLGAACDKLADFAKQLGLATTGDANSPNTLRIHGKVDHVFLTSGSASVPPATCVAPDKFPQLDKAVILSRSPKLLRRAADWLVPENDSGVELRGVFDTEGLMIATKFNNCYFSIKHVPLIDYFELLRE
jgi:hypothetical protein